MGFKKLLLEDDALIRCSEVFRNIDRTFSLAINDPVLQSTFSGSISNVNATWTTIQPYITGGQNPATFPAPSGYIIPAIVQPYVYYTLII